MPVRFGLSLASVADVARHAREAEAQGWDVLAVGEHVHFHVPAANGFVSLSVAAGATERIRLMTTITLLPLYPAALAAKLGAAVDVASGGRFEMGVGVGGELPKEFEACGVPVSERGARTDEALALIRRLWTERDVHFEGRFSRTSGITIDPAPTQRPHPPIWVAGRRDAAMRRAARFADGWLPYMYTPEMLASSIEEIAALRAGTDRAGDPVAAGLFVFASVHPDRDTAVEYAAARLGRQYAQDFSTLVGRYVLAGTPDDCRRRLQEYVDAGASTIVFSSACPQAHVDENHRLLATEVMAAWR